MRLSPMTRASSLAVCLSLLAGCAATSGHRSRLAAPGELAPEEQTTWARPQEVGFDLGEEITGKATRVSILFGLLSFGADDGANVFGWVGGVVGSALGLQPISLGSLDPLARAAAGEAVRSEPGTDGIYITTQETSTVNLFLFQTRTAEVRGRALKLRPLGEVSQERADRYRNLRALGRPQLEVPTALKDLLE